MSREGPALSVMQLLLWMVPAGGGLQGYVRALLEAFDGVSEISFYGAAVNPGQPHRGMIQPVWLGAAGAPAWINAARFALRVWRALRGMNLVQIHGIYGAQLMLGAPLCWAARVPYIVNPHNALAPWMLEHKALKKRVFFDTVGGILLRRAACVLATSPLEAEDLARRFPRARIELVPAGIAVPAEPQVELLRETPSPQLRLLYLGSFDPWKRLPSLVRAVAALRADGVDARLVIAGQGPPALEQPVDAEISRCRVGDAVTRAGYVAGESKLELIRRSHVLVLPSATDSYSMATAEALAHGLPVVITEGAGAARDVREHACGTVVPVDDEAALAAALRRYADPELRRAQALAAHRYARAVLDLPVLRTAMVALYRRHARTTA